MILLYFGLILWVLAHLFKRLAPGPRAALGDAGKGLVALALLASVVMMVIGYRGAMVGSVYTPMPSMGHANNLLMLVSVYLFGVGHSKGTLSVKIRHPMLWSVVIWAGAHLLVNGDYASVVLFGGLGAWAIVEMLVINATEGPWQRPATSRGVRADVINGVIAIVIYGIAAGIHFWMGYSPFLGTYG